MFARTNYYLFTGKQSWRAKVAAAETFSDFIDPWDVRDNVLDTMRITLLDKPSSSDPKTKQILG